MKDSKRGTQGGGGAARNWKFPVIAVWSWGKVQKETLKTWEG